MTTTGKAVTELNLNNSLSLKPAQEMRRESANYIGVRSFMAAKSRI